jgi:hypothetical protein
LTLLLTVFLAPFPSPPGPLSTFPGPDWLFGEQPEELVVNFCEAKDKFMADWCPETSPELEEMARAEQIKVVLEANEYSPAIWIISDGVEPKPARKGPRVAFGAKS